MKVIAFVIILLIIQLTSFGQNQKVDSSSIIQLDSTTQHSLIAIKTDTFSTHNIPVLPKKIEVALQNDSNLFINNQYLNVYIPPVSRINAHRISQGNELLFYILAAFLLIFGIFKVFYSRYFNNIFKVFFNTSLRQNQLTDILLQARLASLIFNMLFLVSAGLFVWQVGIHEGLPVSNILFLPISILLIAVIYIGKYLSIKFVGWVTSYKTEANQYIFVTFLINKIVGVLLIPFIIMISLGPHTWVPSVILVSYMLIATLFLLRYFRTYGLLQKHLAYHTTHFLVFFLCIELLPLFAIFNVISRIENTATSLLSAII